MTIQCATHFLKGHPREGQPTHFTYSIINALGKHGLIDSSDMRKVVSKCLDDGCLAKIFPIKESQQIDMYKVHTIRSGNRWKAGDKIHFKAWTGKPYRSKHYQFAPVILCKSVQDIKITHVNKGWNIRSILVMVDNNFIGTIVINDEKVKFCDEKLKTLINNDGLNTQDFVDWFPNDFKGQIIHWTDLKYLK